MSQTRQSYIAILMLAVAGVCAWPLAAQPETDLARQQEAIATLSFMVGDWQGKSELRQGSESSPARVTEKVSLRLDGTLLMIEGHAVGEDAKGDGYRSLGLIWFDPSEDRYRMKAFSPGRVIDAEIEVTEDGFAWGFESDDGQTRYSNTFDEDTWAEQGEFSRDGETWTQFFIMALERTADAE